MLEEFFNYISKHMSLTDEEAKAISETINIQEFKKGTVLLEEGQVSREGYFILKGCIRNYKIVDGNERTTNFYTEFEWVVSPASYSQKEPSAHYLSCIEDCTLIVGTEKSEQEFYKLYQEFPRLQSLAHIIMESEISKYQEMFSTYKTDTPEQRYMNLLKNRPELLQRVTLQQLASYIGVTPESLSRIRKRILKDK